jgi:hypothetical protein
LDKQIDSGKQLTIDAIVAENLSSNCLTAWKDMQRAGIISPSFLAKVQLTKVAPAVINRRVNLSPPCAELNMSIKGANMAQQSINPVLQPHTVKRTAVTASTTGQPIGPCLKQNLTKDTLDSLLLEFKDVFEADKMTPLKGDPMQIHLKWNDPSYRPIRISQHRKVLLHFQEEADKTLKWFLDSSVIVPVPPTENV